VDTHRTGGRQQTVFVVVGTAVEDEKTARLVLCPDPRTVAVGYFHAVEIDAVAGDVGTGNNPKSLAACAVPVGIQRR